MNGRCRVRKHTLALGGAALVGGIGYAARAEIPPYALVGSFELPTSTDAFDVMADGRVISISGGQIFEQDALASGSFSPLASVDAAIFDGPFGNFGAGFVSMSPDGSKIAIGDNGAADRVHLLDVGSLDPDPMLVSSTTPVDAVVNFEAHWHDAQTLFVTGGDFGSPASVVRITAPTVDTATTATVISNIGGSPGGVTTDGAFLYAGNGFASGASSVTGEVRAVPLAGALAMTPTAVDFESDAIPIAIALSGSALAFDGLGNLIIGGGDFAGEQGFFSVIDSDAVAAALSGGPIAPDSSEAHFTPAGSMDFYTTRFNAESGEIFVQPFGVDTVFRYAIVPSPGAGMGTVLMVGGLVLRRGRRVAA